MSTGSNAVDGVREVSPEVGARLDAIGRIADLSREQVIVHVGKPVGSVTGWVGPIFWQVWSDRGDAAGLVHACIGEGETVVWQFDAALDKAQLLALAKDRAIAEGHALRTARLATAHADLAA
jgi:hypothetical protein